jgi:hypothetical protein
MNQLDDIISNNNKARGFFWKKKNRGQCSDKKMMALPSRSGVRRSTQPEFYNNQK